jgi:hypothetical protein
MRGTNLIPEAAFWWAPDGCRREDGNARDTVAGERRKYRTHRGKVKAPQGF